MLEIHVLGPLEVRRDGAPVPLASAKQRALVAALLARGGAAGADSLVADLWGDDAPPSVRKTLHVTVSRLRRALGDPDALVTDAAGYRLSAATDAERFERLAAAGRRELEGGRPEDAVAALTDALALWRGPALADVVAAAPVVAREAARLEELRAGALEDRLEAELRLGRGPARLVDIERLAEEEPLRERPVALLMRALYQAGRQADALAAYRAYRTRLDDELGLEPGRGLRALELAILEQDPALDAPGPVEPSPGLIGRDGDQAALRAALTAPASRLVTVTGPGGVGKTTLALAVAERWEREPVVTVALAGVPDAGAVPVTLLRALAARPLEGEASEDALVRVLAAGRRLVLLDNCEHLLDLAPMLGRLLAACPGLTVLATSREALRLRGERVHALAPLGEDAAIALLRARATDAAAELPPGEATETALRQLARALAGLPLALELAAARLVTLSPAQLVQRLDALADGPRDAPDRQRSLRAAFDWSYSLLTPHEQECFAALSVFRGGATLEAADAVAGADLETLHALVAKHMVVRRADGPEPRFAMLEPIRRYAAERLTDPAVADRHARQKAAVAERLLPSLRGPRSRESMAGFDAELDDLRAAFEHAIGARDAELALRLAATAAPYFARAGAHGERLAWTDAALALDGGPATLRARALKERGAARYRVHRDDAGAIADLNAALALFRSVGNGARAASCLAELAFIHGMRREQATARALAHEAVVLAEAAGDDPTLAHALDIQATTLAPDDARGIRERAMALHRRIGDSRTTFYGLTNVGYSVLTSGDLATAGPMLEEAFALACRDSDERDREIAETNVGLVRLFSSDFEAAREHFLAALEIQRRAGLEADGWEPLSGLAAVAARAGDLERAARLAGASEASRDVPRSPLDDRIEREFLAPARVLLGPDGWDAERERGRVVGLERAREEAAAVSAPAVPASGAPPAGAPDVPALIGRDGDVWILATRLRRERLVTVTGPAGVGKTSLSVAAATTVAPAFDLTAFAALAPLARAGDVIAAIARAAGAATLDGESPHDALRRTLAGRRVLLVADNFEHVLDAAGDVATLLRECPGLTLLVTSREALGVAAERLHPLAPLAMPAGDAAEPLDVAAAPATALLTDRVRRHDPAFAVTAENASALATVARRLDGLPLAIELAAARMRLLSPAALASRLERAVDTLGQGPRDSDPRQRTLRATLDWSHDLLDEDERAAFARFSVLAGGATVELAETITGADAPLLEALAAKHLLRRAGDRLSMLRVVREYAAERLAARPDAAAAHAALLAACLRLAEAAAPELDGADAAQWFARLDAEEANLAAALEWGIGEDPATALELVAALGAWWRRSGRSQEGRRFLEAALAAGDDVGSARARATARVGFLLVTGGLDAPDRKRRLLDEAIALAPDADTRVLALTARVQLEVSQTAYEAAEPYAREALAVAADASDDARGRALMAAVRTVTTLPEALELLDQASELFQRTGRLAPLSELLGSVGWFALEEGDPATADRILGQAAELAGALPDKASRAFITGNRAVAALLAGRREEARAGFLAELRDGADARVDDMLGEALLGLAALAATDGRSRAAARLLGASERRRPGFVPDRVERRILDGFLADRDCPEWVQERAAGRALDLDAAVSAGLAEAGG